MEIAPRYEAANTENKWYSYWMENGYFDSVPDEREPYTIVIPPPNVTGVLHMGHMLNNTIQDVLIRRARMRNYNACWVPGTDHASIATEAKVVVMLREKGIKKSSLSREEFLSHAWEWKEKHGGIILDQLKKLGASCDWKRTHFTMEPALSESVTRVFIDLYRKGLIYRGMRMVNWDPKALTALSDEEVTHKEVRSKLYKLRYQLKDADGHIIIATTRPETILADAAICVHPDDERYQHLHGKEVIIPIAGRTIPVIADPYVDMEFGTGCLKVTPAHDVNDYELGKKHNLPVIDMFTPEARVKAGTGHYEGMDRFAVRKQIVKDLAAAGLLESEEDYTNKVGYSERTDEVIEPRLSMQWFLKMKELSGPALEHVMNDNIRFYPAKFKNTYRHWMENIHDWCISRQLWWGQRIPAWYNAEGDYAVAETEEEARSILEKEGKSSKGLTQDEDVVDTWFSSWLWPMSVFDGIRNPDNPEIKYYYPTTALVTAPEIMFFWVARMIMAGYEYRQEKPFSHVYFTGIVRDKLGRKMSKSLGNSPDPLKLIDSYGADGVRVGMLLTSPAGNDLPFDEALCEQGRNFCNKIWNAFRLVHGWEVSESLAQPAPAAEAVRWFEARLQEGLTQAEEHYERFRLSEALMTVYKLIWDDFCSWYLEAVKPAFGEAADKKTVDATYGFFGMLLKLLHPFAPFISEELWSLIPGTSGPVIVAEYPEPAPYDQKLNKNFEHAREVIIAVRNFRATKQISPKEVVELYLRGNAETIPYKGIITKLANLSKINSTDIAPADAYTFVVAGTEYYIPFTASFDREAEIQRIKDELDYTRGFLQSVQKKLNNDKFVNNAPEKVVETEKKKQFDAENKIRALEEQLNSLSGN